MMSITRVEKKIEIDLVKRSANFVKYILTETINIFPF